MSSSHHAPAIGGPRSNLPARVESFLAWSFAIACLAISGYHYVVGTLLRPYWKQARSLLSYQSRTNKQAKDECTSSADTTRPSRTLPCWLPLTSHSRGELDRSTPMERYQQFLDLLQTLVITNESNNNNDTELKSQSESSILTDDNALVSLIRNNASLRRLASLAMRPTDPLQESNDTLSKSAAGQQLIRIWPRLLQLPACGQPQDFEFQVSLIVPCYKEDGRRVCANLHYALGNSVCPQNVQVVLVDAGKCTNLHLITATTTDNATGDNDTNARQWGQVKTVEFRSHGGRGPCLNFGAEHADGRVFAFLHSDTKLPANWDWKVMQVFDSKSTETKDDANAVVRANACAFGFGIDASVEGLNGGACPPGIRAVEITANLRCRLWSLPYGDQCLCVPSNVFHYLGGMPHQCFMEDYEFIALFRKRAALLPCFGLDCEALVIVPGAPALCSPRRWQSFGVLYVTYMNSKLVNRYAAGQTPQQIYQQYYGHALVAGDEPSPWEMQLLDNSVDKEL